MYVVWVWVGGYGDNAREIQPFFLEKDLSDRASQLGASERKRKYTKGM